jgi:hypothetical protein
MIGGSGVVRRSLIKRDARFVRLGLAKPLAVWRDPTWPGTVHRGVV